MGTLENSEDLDEMLHSAAFHLGLHCSRRQKQSSCIEEHLKLDRHSYLPVFLFVFFFLGGGGGGLV